MALPGFKHQPGQMKGTLRSTSVGHQCCVAWSWPLPRSRAGSLADTQASTAGRVAGGEWEQGRSPAAQAEPGPGRRGLTAP